MKTSPLSLVFALCALPVLACSTPPPPVDVPDAGALTDVTDAANDTGTATDVVDVPPAPCEAGILCTRPFRLTAPASANANTPLPLVILLHGYMANGAAQDLYFGIGRQVEAKQFLYAVPDGLVDAQGNRFWNATDACCNFNNNPTDDVAYVRAIIENVSSRYAVDPNRVFVIGHSNGGFMANRLACDLSDKVSAIVSLAGANWSDMSRCAPSGRVSVLLAHGTADETIAYTGGMILNASYPGAVATADGWATRNGCTLPRVSAGANVDLVPSLTGDETVREQYNGCAQGGAVELWSIQGGSHVPIFSTAWATSVIDWLYAHPRPSR